MGSPNHQVARKEGWAGVETALGATQPRLEGKSGELEGVKVEPSPE